MLFNILNCQWEYQSCKDQMSRDEGAIKSLFSMCILQNLSFQVWAQKRKLKRLWRKRIKDTGDTEKSHVSPTDSEGENKGTENESNKRKAEESDDAFNEEDYKELKRLRKTVKSSKAVG